MFGALSLSPSLSDLLKLSIWFHFHLYTCLPRRGTEEGKPSGRAVTWPDSIRYEHVTWPDGGCKRKFHCLMSVSRYKDEVNQKVVKVIYSRSSLTGQCIIEIHKKVCNWGGGGCWWGGGGWDGDRLLGLGLWYVSEKGLYLENYWTKFKKWIWFGISMNWGIYLALKKLKKSRNKNSIFDNLAEICPFSAKFGKSEN